LNRVISLRKIHFVQCGHDHSVQTLFARAKDADMEDDSSDEEGDSIVFRCPAMMIGSSLG